MIQRKHPRLTEYDYSSNGAYFVTVCTKNKEKIFGHVVGAGHLAGPHVELSPFGKIVDEHIRAIPQIYPNVFVDAHIVMPNHIHLIVRIQQEDGPARCPAPTSDLTKIVGALKSLCSREAKRPLWQRGYYEHVVRNYEDYISCAEYVLYNPAKWETDDLFQE
ncbi:MAG: transposase [Oscillospiraceae bacterium]